MKTRLGNLLRILWATYWFIPALLSLAGVILAFVTLHLDRVLEREVVRELGYIYTGGAEGAREVFNIVGSSMITIAGVTFSITIVALTLAAQQLGPRLLQNFVRDTGNKLVLGTFVATFLYCLIVLRSIRSEEENLFVPHISVTVAVLLAIASIAVLIYFIHHIATSINVSYVVQAVTRDFAAAVEEPFPAGIGQNPGANTPSSVIPNDLEEHGAPVHSRKDGYIQAVDGHELMRAAATYDILVCVTHGPGTFAGEGSVLARVWPVSAEEEALSAVRSAFVLGENRTHVSDAEFSLKQLIDIALRALSPSTNDPHTAITCINFIGAALVRMSRRRLPSRYRCDADGQVRVIAEPVTFSQLMDTSFGPIRQHAGVSSAVYLRMLHVIDQIAPYAEQTEIRSPLLRHTIMIERAAIESLPEELDRESVKELAGQIMHRLSRAANGERPDALATDDPTDNAPEPLPSTAS